MRNFCLTLSTKTNVYLHGARAWEAQGARGVGGCRGVGAGARRAGNGAAQLELAIGRHVGGIYRENYVSIYRQHAAR